MKREWDFKEQEKERKRKKEKGLSNQNQAKENLQPTSYNFENFKLYKPYYLVILH